MRFMRIDGCISFSHTLHMSYQKLTKIALELLNNAYGELRLHIINNTSNKKFDKLHIQFEYNVSHHEKCLT